MPKIPGVLNLKAGSKGRNFESFTGLMDPKYIKNAPEAVKQLAYHNKKNGELTKVLIKLYKQQQAKIDEAAN